MTAAGMLRAAEALLRLARAGSCPRQIADCLNLVRRMRRLVAKEAVINAP